MQKSFRFWMVLVPLVALTMATTASADWSAQTLSGYTYYTDGATSAFPLSTNQYFYQTRYDDNRMMTTVTSGNGSDAVAYLDANSGIYDLAAGVWQRRTQCDLAGAKTYRDQWYKLHIENVGKYYQAYCYAKYVEADFYLKACKSYHR